MIVPQFEKLVHQFLTGEISIEDEANLFHLLNNSSYYSLYEYYVGVWLDNEAKRDATAYSSETAYRLFEKLAVKLQKKETTTRFMRFVKYAAIIAIIFSTGLILMNGINKIESSSVIATIPHELLIPRGSMGEMVLPDGTRVWINSDSKITYYSDYNKNNRQIFLEGEAYFQVAKDKNRPFIVHADDLSIRAVGTAFNVFTSKGVIETSLDEGCVELTRKLYNEEPLVMSPGEKAIFNKENQTLKVGKTDVKTLTSWRNKKWVIRSMQLADLLERLERRYDVNIDVVDPNILKTTVSASFINEDIQQIMNGLASALDFNIEQTGSHFKIY